MPGRQHGLEHHSPTHTHTYLATDDDTTLAVGAPLLSAASPVAATAAALLLGRRHQSLECMLPEFRRQQSQGPAVTGDTPQDATAGAYLRLPAAAARQTLDFSWLCCLQVVWGLGQQPCPAGPGKCTRQPQIVCTCGPPANA